MSKTRNRTEQDFHMTVARYLDLALPDYCVWTTFPAGGGGKIRGGILNGMGLKAGWPDIQIIVSTYVSAQTRNTWATLVRFIGLELKGPSGKVSKDQADCHKRIRDIGGYVYIVRNLEQVYEVLHAHEKLELKAKPLMAPSGAPPGQSIRIQQ